jgi:asparagine synthase (glutamine-hydrolysing)
LPRPIIAGNKRGFTIPLAAWLRTDLQPLARDVLSDASVRRQGFFRPDAVTRMLDDHVAGHEDNSRKLWALLVLTFWLARYYDGNGRIGS